MYEMAAETRAILVGELRTDGRFGVARLQRISEFLIDYADQHVRSPDDEVRNFARVQRSTALAHLDASTASEELAREVSRAVENKDASALLRYAALIEGLTLSGADLEGVWRYTRSVAKWVRGDHDAAALEVAPMMNSDGVVSVGKVTVAIPPELLEINKSKLITRPNDVFNKCRTFTRPADPFLLDYRHDPSARFQRHFECRVVCGVAEGVVGLQDVVEGESVRHQFAGNQFARLNRFQEHRRGDGIH